MKEPRTKDGRTVYVCAFDHEHDSMTTAVLCESAPKRDVLVRMDMEGDRIVEDYWCNRCGARSRSVFNRLTSIKNSFGGHDVARIVTMDDLLQGCGVLAWQGEAAIFHEAHTGCNADNMAKEAKLT